MVLRNALIAALLTGISAAGAEATALNNLVYQLLDVRAQADRPYVVNHSREGWLFIRLTLETARAPTVRLDDKDVTLRRVANGYEAMRYLPEGTHTVTLQRPLKAPRLEVRAIGELYYAMYGIDPLVPETGHYDWAFLREHVLDHVNSIVGRAGKEEAFGPEIDEWTGDGRRWMTQHSLPWDRSVDAVYEYWAKQPGMVHPKLSGIWADEFSSGERYRQMYPIWCAAIRRLKANPAFAGRIFYAFVGATYHDDCIPLIKTIGECNYRLGPEWYLRERKTLATAVSQFGPNWERNSRAGYDRAHPGAGNNRVWVLGLLSQPEESCDVFPHCDFNAYLDMQFQYIATEQAFVGLRGVYGYYSPYMGEEQLRLYARLLRHYCIEGRTDRMLPDPYILPHLQNPDFTEGTNGWTLEPAGADNDRISTAVAKGFGWLQGRYMRDVGEHVLVTRRSADGPNRFSQPIRKLDSGRLYSLRFFTGHRQDLADGVSRRFRHAVSVRIESGDVIPDKTFQAVVRSNYGHAYGPFKRSHRYFSNYHQVVFRATGDRGRLVLSDWRAAIEPGGPVDEPLMWNFIQLQPYFVP